MVSFKWNSYGYYNHYLGFFMHIQYVLCMTLYIYNTFLIGVYARVSEQVWTWLLVLGICYPFIYDSCQLYKQGLQYFEDSWNYTDLAFQYSGLVNIVFKFVYPEQDALPSLISMSLVLLLATVKTMFFLRVFEKPSYLVTLVRQVIADLRYFVMFYLIITFMFSLIMGVIGFQNYTNCGYQQKD